MHNGIRPRIGPWLFYIQYRPTRLWWPVMASALGGETSICFCHATVREGKARPQRVPLLARAHAPSQQPHGTPSHRVQTDRETGSKTACSPMSLDHHGHRADLGRILLSHRLPRRLDLLSHPPSSRPFNCGTPAAWALLALSRSLSASKLTYRLT